MDNDDEGRRVIEGAISRNVLEPSDYNLATRQGMQNSELEDLIQLDAYSSVVQEKFGVILDQPRFRYSRAKWSDRLKDIFKMSGKMWNNAVKIQIKRTITDACIQFGPDSLNPHHRSPIDSLITALESKLQGRIK
jgi:hypothetical protein